MNFSESRSISEESQRKRKKAAIPDEGLICLEIWKSERPREDDRYNRQAAFLGAK